MKRLVLALFTIGAAMLLHSCCGSLEEAAEEAAKEALEESVEEGAAKEAAAPDRQAKEYSEYKVVLFIQKDRTSFNARESRLLDEIEKLGFEVKRRPGGGGTNEDASIKVGKRDKSIAEVVSAVIQKHYQEAFPIREIFDKGDRDIFINLGPHAMAP